MHSRKYYVEETAADVNNVSQRMRIGKNKIFAIGDIHGCLGKLRPLIQNINADPENDTIVFIGDYIDRGSAAREVVDYVIKLKAEYKNVVCLLGNHEYMFLRYLDGLDA